MARILFVVFTIIPIIEIAVFILLGQTIGLWPTLLGVLATAVIGALMVRIQGLSLIAEIRETVARGRLPARALGDAMLVGMAGVLLLTPGYFTDLLGILLLIPPVRGLIYKRLARRFGVVTPAAPAGDPRIIDLDAGDFRRPGGRP
jgi:UPF0716 protein FxsA